MAKELCEKAAIAYFCAFSDDYPPIILRKT